MKEFNLSELENDCVKGFMTKDVKEFIRLLEERMRYLEDDKHKIHRGELILELDKLAGEELI